MKIEETHTYIRGDTYVKAALVEFYADADILCDGPYSDTITILSYHSQDNALRYAAFFIPGITSRVSEALKSYCSVVPLELSMDFNDIPHLCSFLAGAPGEVLKEWMTVRGYSKKENGSWVLEDLEE